MKKSTLFLLTLALALGVSSCKDKDEPTLGDPPTAADAEFTYEATAENDNIIDFTASNASLTAKWDFGNGTTGEGTTAQATYPNKGTYTVTLTVFNSGGSKSSSQDIVIEKDDNSLLDNPLYELLTGGINGSGSKTWVMDSTRVAHLGVGPVAGTWPEWWDADPLDKAGTGLYDDKYVFKLDAFKFDHISNGDAYAKTGHEGEFSGSSESKGDFKVDHPNQLDETWTLTEGEEDTTLTVSGTAFFGLYTGTRTYKVVKLTENELTLRYLDTKDATTAWYVRLVPDDYPIDGGGGEDPTFSLPIDFESSEPTWNVFGNSSYSILDNPYSSGINKSLKVLETVHGNETWAGLFVNLDSKLDLTGADSMISVLVYAPTTGTMRFKIENSENTDEFEERDVMVNTANAWVKVAVGFSTADTDKYDRLVLFPGWDVADAGTFYLDDIRQE